MPLRQLFIASHEEELCDVAELIANQLGWEVLTFSEDATRERLQAMIEKTKSVYVIRNHESDNHGLADLVRGLAAQGGCEYWEHTSGSDEPSSFIDTSKAKEIEYDVCLAIEDTLSVAQVAVSVGRLLDAHTSRKKGPEIPFQWLYSHYFEHVKHEANWVNSRFMWFMFAMSALVALYGTFSKTDLAFIPVGIGLALSALMLVLQGITFRAEGVALDKCDLISRDWKKEVPRMGDYLFETAYGGNSEHRHKWAKRCMFGIVVLFLILWLCLAGVAYYS